MNKTDSTLPTSLAEIEKRLQRSKELGKELDALDATGFESEINSIRAKLKSRNLDNIPAIEKEITNLKEKIEKRLQRLKELEKELNALDATGFESEVEAIKSKLKRPDFSS